MLFINEQQVRENLPMAEAVRLMREVFLALRTGDAQNQPRRRLFLPTGTVLHSMAGAWGKYLGTKVYATNARHGAAYFFFLLFDAETARPLAQIDANQLGQIRTGAASGYATALLSEPGASTLAIIGSGFQARAQLDAIREVRQLGDVRVWSRSPEKRYSFAVETRTRAVESAEEAVRGADIVVTATWAKDPVLESAWISPGTHINAMGSNQAARRELPADLIARADLIAVDALDVAQIEAGDLILAEVDWDDPRIYELAQVTGRPDGDPVTIFKSCGLGVEDVAVAAYLYEKLA
ncbi:MAG TPA: ornithine cyclodeaminase family protein [Bryobacteraceae bacterium]|nr:ornithine cyclodeaminase family protein [Bryobacteraceae bacterium]